MFFVFFILVGIALWIGWHVAPMAVSFLGTALGLAFAGLISIVVSIWPLIVGLVAVVYGVFYGWMILTFLNRNRRLALLLGGIAVAGIFLFVHHLPPVPVTPRVVVEAGPIAPQSEPNIYRWEDEDGTIVFSNLPPTMPNLPAPKEFLPRNVPPTVPPANNAADAWEMSLQRVLEKAKNQLHTPAQADCFARLTSRYEILDHAGVLPKGPDVFSESAAWFRRQQESRWTSEVQQAMGAIEAYGVRPDLPYAMAIVDIQAVCERWR